MKKFDVVIGTPPYTTKDILKYLKKSYDLSDEWLIWLHQSLWMYDENPRKDPKFTYMKKLLNGKIEYIKFFNGTPVFKAGIATPLALTVINKNENDPTIEVDDIINNKHITYKNIYEINKWSDLEIFPPLKKKFEILSNKLGNLYEHANYVFGRHKYGVNSIYGKEEEPHNFKNKYYVNCSIWGGQISWKDINTQKKPGFYTILPKSEKVENHRKKGIFFVFDKENEAQNFLDFLKTKWFSFGLAINKNLQDNGGFNIKLIPWLDWNQEWPFDKFSNLIKATPKEIEFVENHIPDYY